MNKLKFGDITISIASNKSGLAIDIPTLYRQFITDDLPDVVLAVDKLNSDFDQLSSPIFQSGGIWNLYKENEKWMITVNGPPRIGIGRVAKLDSDYRSGEILISEQMVKNRPIHPLDYPLAELITVNLLAQGRGVELHACAVAVDDYDNGLVFVGMSGAGKSTLARLWQKRVGITILSDDRVILLKKNDKYWVYGTPWHGDARVASARSLPIDRIFVLQQAQKNELIMLNRFDAMTKLFMRSFPTYWDAAGMDFALHFLDQVSQSIPCHEFRFLPDQSAIDYILNEI